MTHPPKTPLASEGSQRDFERNKFESSSSISSDVEISSCSTSPCESAKISECNMDEEAMVRRFGVQTSTKVERKSSVYIWPYRQKMIAG